MGTDRPFGSKEPILRSLRNHPDDELYPHVSVLTYLHADSFCRIIEEIGSEYQLIFHWPEENIDLDLSDKNSPDFAKMVEIISQPTLEDVLPIGAIRSQSKDWDITITIQRSLDLVLFFYVGGYDSLAFFDRVLDLPNELGLYSWFHDDVLDAFRVRIILPRNFDWNFLLQMPEIQPVYFTSDRRWEREEVPQHIRLDEETVKLLDSLIRRVPEDPVTISFSKDGKGFFYNVDSRKCGSSNNNPVLVIQTNEWWKYHNFYRRNRY